MFDTHCHLDFEPFDHDRAAACERAHGLGVLGVHIPGVFPEQWSRARSLALLHTDSGVRIGSGVGIHPQFLADLTPAALDAGLTNLQAAAMQEHAEAIGECGLDGPVAKRGGPSLDDQVRVLDVHLEVARALELPIVLHVLRAHGRALEVLQRHGSLPAGGVLHSYSGSAELVPRYAQLGLCFSFGGVVTRANARRPHAAVRAVPSDRLLLESDGPDQPLLGRSRGAPEDLPVTAQAVAQLRGEPAIAEITHANANRLFRRSTTGGRS